MKQNKIIQDLIKRIKKTLFTIHYPLLSKGQSIMEYALLVTVVVGAFMAMQVYMKRGINAVIKKSTDQFGTQDSDETDPEKAAVSNSTTNTMSNSVMNTREEGAEAKLTATTETDSTSISTGNATYVQEEDTQ